MNKLSMESCNLNSVSIYQIEQLFPNVIKESTDKNGNIIKCVDFDALRAELEEIKLNNSAERYELNWPGKNEAKKNAFEKTTNTLRPLKEKSEKFEETKNIYIEGDNLEVLKILQNAYLGAIKIIYIDPPYNTGSDLIYSDNYKTTELEELEKSGEINSQGDRLTTNSSSNGRFHSDWLSMMYPRLKLSRNLLKDDGVIFISIDENEIDNLKKMCDEIFGEQNYIGEVVRKTKSMTGDAGTGFNNQHEYLLIYAKSIEYVNLIGGNKDLDGYTNPDNDPNGDWCSGDPSAKSGGPSTYFEIENPYTHKVDLPPAGRYWAFSKSTLQNYIQSGRVKFKEKYSDRERGFVFKRYKKDLKNTFLPLDSLFGVSNDYMNQAATKELNELMGFPVFSYPKPVSFMKKIIESNSNEGDIILDFFSGSATTAHATLDLNANDGKGRKFIMVQLQESVEDNNDYVKLGYKTICDIGEERIRKASKKIKEETDADIDYGFKVFKVDSSNMKDSFYIEANTTKQSDLFNMETNIKEGRNGEDLIIQVMLNLGLQLDAKIEEKEIGGNNFIFVENNGIIACFDPKFNFENIEKIAEMKPLEVVFKDESFKSDNDKINLQEQFKKMSPNTRINIL